jgi:hypothetical protein
VTRSEQILRDARGLGLCYMGEPPPEVIALWDQGWLRRSGDLPHTYFSVDGAIEEEADPDDGVRGML